MKFSRVDWFFLLIFPLIYIEAGLNPEKDNVCLKTITYNETIKVTVHRPASKTDKIMCLKKKYCNEDITIDLKEPRVITRTKILPSCCEGYKEDKEGTQCVPVCPNGCGNGKCVAPGKCTCEPGFFGSECEKICGKGRWGENCLLECDCSENEVCNKILGCVCAPGWIGVRCRTRCPVGYYGFLCQEKCLCTDNIFCNHITGKCIDSTEAIDILGNESKINRKNETKSNQTSVEITKVQGNELTESSSSTNASPKETFVQKVVATLSETDGDVTFKPTCFKSDEAEERKKVKEEIVEAESSIPLREAKFKDLSESGQFPEAFNIFNTHGCAKGVDVLKESTKNLTILRNNILQAKDLFNSPSSNTAVGSAQSSRVSNFIPTFTVLSSLAVLIILVTAKRLIIISRKKIKKMTNVEFGCSDEEFSILSGEKLTWENNVENPVCMVDIINAAPTLQTFKPQVAKTQNMATEKKICHLAK